MYVCCPHKSWQRLWTCVCVWCRLDVCVLFSKCRRLKQWLVHYQSLASQIFNKSLRRKWSAFFRSSAAQWRIHTVTLATMVLTWQVLLSPSGVASDYMECGSQLKSFRVQICILLSSDIQLTVSHSSWWLLYNIDYCFTKTITPCVHWTNSMSIINVNSILYLYQYLPVTVPVSCMVDALYVHYVCLFSLGALYCTNTAFSFSYSSLVLILFFFLPLILLLLSIFHHHHHLLLFLLLLLL